MEFAADLINDQELRDAAIDRYELMLKRLDARAPLSEADTVLRATLFEALTDLKNLGQPKA